MKTVLKKRLTTNCRYKSDNSSSKTAKLACEATIQSVPATGFIFIISDFLFGSLGNVRIPPIFSPCSKTVLNGLNPLFPIPLT
ncbi:hypothetical protein D3C86_1835800 [compost metagenome]